MKGCEFDECTEKYWARGYCRAHYGQLRAGRLLTPLDPEARCSFKFWSRVDKSGHCWIWQGYTTDEGYGRVGVNGKLVLAHRFAYADKVGPIPDGRLIDHRCMTRACVRPDHLRVATHSENMQNKASAHSNSKSGVRGVHWSARSRKWIAAAQVSGIRWEIGAFTELREAELAIRAWRRKHMPFSESDQVNAGGVVEVDD